MTSTRPLRDKAALVIGGSRGIGRAVTERLAADVCFYEDSTVKLPASRRNLISASEGSGRQNRDLRSGTVEGSRLCSSELLSVQDVDVQHHMLHARQAHWQSPVTNAPHLLGRSHRSDPRSLRAR